MAPAHARIVLGAVAACILVLCEFVHGGTLTVTNANDSGAGSLRQAIADASPGDTIDFDGSLSGQSILLSSGQLVVDKPLTINGPGANLLTVSGQDLSRVFRIDDGTAAVISVAIKGLTIRDGMANGDYGGGIFNTEQLVLEELWITENDTGNSIPYGGFGAYNGAAAELAVYRSTFSQNGRFSNGNQGGGGLLSQGDLFLQNCTFSGNYASSSGGGGALTHSYGLLTATNCTFANNEASSINTPGITIAYTSGILESCVFANGEPGFEVGVDIELYGATVTAISCVIREPGTSGIPVGGVEGNIHADPLLGPLRDNGGSVPTHLPSRVSLAIDRGSNSSAIIYDQRGPGFPREADGFPDAGAVEFNLGDIPADPMNTDLEAILEDLLDADNPGTLVRDLTSNSGSSVPDATGLGVALLDSDDTGNGTWQYSTDDGLTWSEFPALSESASLCLSHEDRIRFSPNLNFNTTVLPKPSLTFLTLDDPLNESAAVRDLNAPGPRGPDYLVSGSQTWFEPAVSTSSSGGYTAFWSEIVNFSDSAVRQSFDGWGRATGPRDTSNSPNAEFGTRLSGLANGKYVLTWMEDDADSIGIYAQIFASDHSSDGPAFLVNTTETGPQIAPSVAMLEDEGFIVTWDGLDSVNGGWDLFAQRFNADGSANGAEFQINLISAGVTTSSVAGLAGGGWVCSWIETGSGYSVNLKRYASDGSTVFGDTVVANEPDAYNVGILGLADGGYAVTWSDSNDNKVYFRIFNEDDSQRTGAVHVNDADGTAGHSPRIIQLSNGSIAVTWSEPFDGLSVASFSRVYDSSGNPITNATELSSHGPSLYHSFAFPVGLANENFVTLWTMIDHPFKANDEIYGRFFGPIRKSAVPAMAFIEIQAVNDPPVANDDSAGADEGQTVNIDIADNDTDADNSLDLTSIQIVTSAAHGSLNVKTDGTVNYTHDGSENFTDSFTYTIKDASAAPSNTATVSLTINPINDKPMANDDSAGVNEGQSVNINVADNDTDADNALDLTSIQIVANATHGSLSVNNDGTVDYTHDGGENFTDSFTYTIDDASGATSNTATVSITITPVNDNPVANNDSGSVNEGQTVSVDVASNDTDADNALDLTSIQIVTSATHGSLQVNNDGTVDYTHDGTENFSDSFTYTIDDASGATSNTATVSITINSVNDQPVAGILGSDPFYVEENELLPFEGTGTDAEDGTNVTYSWDWDDSTTDGTAQNPSHAWDEPGVYLVTLVVTDQDGLSSDPVTAQVIVTPKAGERDLFLKRGKFAINWKAHNDGVDKDSLSVQGWVNPAGCNANLSAATFEVSVNGVLLGAAPLASNGKGSTATAKASLKAKTGAFSFSVKDADLRTALGLANTTEVGTVEFAVGINIQNAGLYTDTFMAHAQFDFTTKQDMSSKGSFNFKTADSSDGYFFAAKTTVTEDKTGSHKVSVKGYFDAPGGASLVPAGDVTLTIGAESMTIPAAGLTVSGGIITLPKGAHPDLAKFILDTNKELFTIQTNALAGTGVPPAGNPAISHDLLVRIEIPTAGDPIVFETTVEILRSSSTSKVWKR